MWCLRPCWLCPFWSDCTLLTKAATRATQNSFSWRTEKCKCCPWPSRSWSGEFCDREKWNITILSGYVMSRDKLQHHYFSQYLFHKRNVIPLRTALLPHGCPHPLPIGIKWNFCGHFEMNSVCSNYQKNHSIMMQISRNNLVRFQLNISHPWLRLGLVYESQFMGISLHRISLVSMVVQSLSMCICVITLRWVYKNTIFSWILSTWVGHQ